LHFLLLRFRTIWLLRKLVTVKNCWVATITSDVPRILGGRCLWNTKSVTIH
jgi:hypothetical protein